MKTITFSSPHRQKHFDFFRRMDQPHFGVTANVEITDFLELVRSRADLRFTPALVYLLSRTANDVTNLRRRIRGEAVVEHEAVHPSFTVPTRRDEVFSFCTVTYREAPREFHDAADAMMKEMYDNPSFEDEPGRDDYLFMSAFPWASFTQVSHAMHYSPVDSVPRITWGKYFKRDGKALMPLSVQAHHAIVDGIDLGRYFQGLERYLRTGNEIFSEEK